jgi:CMP-N-acetylneuraminic acid synthetase
MVWVIAGRRVLAVCPARGGSKGVALKNLQPFLGLPLVARVGQLVRDIPLIDRAVVSTDHPEIARVAQEAGLDAPFFRSEELSGDRVAMRWRRRSGSMA